MEIDDNRMCSTSFDAELIAKLMPKSSMFVDLIEYLSKSQWILTEIIG